MRVQIRRADPNDRTAVLGLWTALHAEHEALDSRYRLSEKATTLWANDFKEWVQDRKQHAYFVAQAPDGLLVGLLVAHLLATTPVYVPERFIHIDDLYVKPAVRGQGIGRGLVDAVRGWAAEHDVSGLRVGVLASNPDGLSFWEKVGGHAYSVSMTLPV